MTYRRVVLGGTRDGVDTRKKENSAVPCEVRRGDNLSMETIMGLGHPAVTNWGDIMTGMKRTGQGVVRTAYNAADLYADMADEPWKYGDEDMFAWLDLDDRLRETPERAAYWKDREDREQAEQAREEAKYQVDRKRLAVLASAAAKAGMKRWVERDIRNIVKRFKGSATKIQALVRGYQTRCKNPHLDCCMCLSHRISPLKTEVGYMCRGCAELGPYEDLVEGDPWNWHRAVPSDCAWCATDKCDYTCEWA